MNAQVITLSSKGQVSIPVDMRREMKLAVGDKLVAYTSGDFIMLKVLKLPSAEEIKADLDFAQQWAADMDYSDSDVDEIIKSARKSKK